jgi:hypothetical protein
MLRGTITLADRGAFLRACDRLGLPLFTVLNARRREIVDRNRETCTFGPTGPVGGRERSVARKLCYEFAQPIAGVREDRDSVADDERVEVECEDAPQTRA